MTMTTKQEPGSATMPMMKGGELIAETLVQEKVPYVFGICGHGNVGILDALYDVRDELQLISPRHEQCAGHMADAYFRVKHRPVATLTSTGPGSANLVMSLATALSDSSAFMAITANVPTSQHNRAPFQELYKHNQADFAQVLRPVVKRAFQPTRVDMLPLALRQGLDTMVTGRPGPVNLDIPYNVFQEEDDVELPARSHLDRPHRPGASDADVGRGAGPAGRGAQAGALHRPRRHAVGGRARDHRVRAPAGHPGHHLAQRHGLHPGRRPAGAGLHRPQRRLPGQPGRALCRPGHHAGHALRRPQSSSSWHPGYSWNFPKTKLLHVDIDPQELGRNYPPTLGHHRRRQDLRAPVAQRLAGAHRDRRAALRRVAARGAGLAGRVGSLRAPALRATRRARCGPSSWSARCRRCCPTT